MGRDAQVIMPIDQCEEHRQKISDCMFNNVVHGGWGHWTAWDECPVTCGGADQGRTRICDSPSPEVGGDECTSDGSVASETQRCNEQSCTTWTYIGVKGPCMADHCGSGASY